MSRFALAVIAWALLLAVGFGVVFTLGAALPSTEEQLAAAMSPTPPVSEEAARRSAETIIRLQYSQLESATPTVERKTDFGIDYWLISYSDSSTGAPMGVLISVVVQSGRVEIATFP